MIAYLSGTIINKIRGALIINVHDVGYAVQVTPTVLAKAIVGETAEFYVHQYVREDALDLYGFQSIAELELFEMFLSVSGVGPKSAQGILSIASVDDLKETIARGDSSLLTKVSGIGRKTAERVVLELREKIRGWEAVGAASSRKSFAAGEEIDALMALGYSMQQAREALSAIDEKIKDSGDRIKQALKILDSKR